MSILRSIYSTFSLACGGPGGSVGRGGPPEPRPTYLYRRPGSGRMTWRLMVSFGGWRVARHGGPPALAVAHGDHTPTLRSGLELSQGDHTPTLRYNPLVPIHPLAFSSSASSARAGSTRRNIPSKRHATRVGESVCHFSSLHLPSLLLPNPSPTSRSQESAPDLTMTPPKVLMVRMIQARMRGVECARGARDDDASGGA